jgi:hypothetical protein
MYRRCDHIHRRLIRSGNIAAAYTCGGLSPVDDCSRTFFHPLGILRAGACTPAGAREPHPRNHIFVPPCPGAILRCRSSMAILLLYTAGLVIAILVLAIVAFVLLLDDDRQE